MTKEHPIIFSAPMVQALLDGRKTQTRRIINPQPVIDEDSGSIFDGKHRAQYDIHNWKERFIDDWSRWMPEDLLWVRETYQKFDVQWSGNLINVYKADYKNREWEEWTSEEESENKFTWQPSIFMPKIAARIWLEVANIHIERLNDISEEDAIAEGVSFHLPVPGDGLIVWENYTSPKTPFYGDNAKLSYQTLWQKINGEESWDKNPFVWVIEFKKLTK